MFVNFFTAKADIKKKTNAINNKRQESTFFK